MVHRVFGWIGGYLRVRVQGEYMERFVNLCRNRGIMLWQLCMEPKGRMLYFCITLKDFYKLRPLARKCRVHVIVVKRYGLPFLIDTMKKRASFCIGVCLCFLLVFFLSTRIWGIYVEGQSFHTRESIINYLDSIDVYGGMAGKKLECSSLEEKIRETYSDIGWVSVERKGSKIFIRLKEVLLVEKEKKEKKEHLIADEAGKVVSIVTRKGTAKVRAGDTVKKGAVLISGIVKIYGDNQELVEKERVHAEGTVIIETKEHYEDVLQKKYNRKVYTGKKREVHEWQFGKINFFCYNPLKNLETYENYDIIREGGKVYPFLSVRFPVSHYVKAFREITYQKTEYSAEDAKEILEERFLNYLSKKEAEGYQLEKQNVSMADTKKGYRYSGELVFYKEQNNYRSIQKKSDG